MHVYRIQDLDGRGPFKPGLTDRWLECRPDHENLLPFFEEFPETRYVPFLPGMHYGCGCLTLQQLRRWFSPVEYARLYRMGYRCVKLKIGGLVASSSIQAVFHRRPALHKRANIIALYPSHTIEGVEHAS